MTAKQVFENALVELNKREAPSLILEDYNYFINKAVNQYINKVYNAYDVNQQKSDDLRVLKSTALLTPSLAANGNLLSKAYEVDLPDDYLHILNCIVEYKVKKTYKCYNIDDNVHFGAKRLTADMFSQIINNFYLRPTYKSPYYYINNTSSDFVYPITESPDPIVTGGEIVNYYNITFGTPEASTLVVTKNSVEYTFTYNASPTLATDFSDANTLKTALSTIGVPSVMIGVGVGLLIDSAYTLGISAVTETGNYLTITTGSIIDNTSLVQRVADYRYGNRSKTRLEIRYGKDNATFELQKIYIDYIKAPKYIRLTQEEIEKVEDTSQVLEFPDYVVQEIINELIKLLMENASDPRLQSHIPINQSIANPVQEPQQKR